MTYSDWSEANTEATNAIVQKLTKQGLSKKEIIAYFHFDNMKEAEPSFCPLYETNTKCHD